MKMMHRIGMWLSLLLVAGCVGGPKIDTGIGTAPTSEFGWNIGAADLLDPATASQRLGVYLAELDSLGYAKRIRIIYTPDWGPFILRHWVPVIREKGFRVLVILSQDGRAKPGDSDLANQWALIQGYLSPIQDILDAVQIANEPDGFSGKTPSEYATWHRQVVAMVRQIVPGVPIVGPDLRGVGSWNEWVLKTGLLFGPDYDIVSLHVTHVTRVEDLKAYVADVERLTRRVGPRTWITEGDWGQYKWFWDDGHLPIDRAYVYVWNGSEPESRRPGGVLK